MGASRASSFSQGVERSNLTLLERAARLECFEVRILSPHGRVVMTARRRGRPIWACRHDRRADASLQAHVVDLVERQLADMKRRWVELVVSRLDARCRSSHSSPRISAVEPNE